MYLYLISQNVNSGYDTYDGMVVAARSETEAKSITPEFDSEITQSPDNFNCGYTWANSPDQVTVKLIGKAYPGTKIGVILASYNAG